MLGCQLAIDHAGQDVVSTQYIKEVRIHFLKLHPSLVREIHPCARSARWRCAAWWAAVPPRPG